MNQPEPTGQPAWVVRYRRWLIAGAVVVFVLALGVVLYPFIPSLEYSLGLVKEENPYVSRLGTGQTLPETGIKPIPTDNRLVIPKIGVDAPIVEGASQNAALEKGIWHIPNTAASPEASNLVLSAHRWRYLPPSSRSFYLLDKLDVGDDIIIYWEGKEFDYKVGEEKTVDPTAVEILEPTDQPQLTLFTCTPLWSTKHRLVLIAKPT